MRVTKWVDFGADVKIDIGIDDIRGALAEAFESVTRDRLGEEGPNRTEVTYALNSIGAFLRALTDEHIALLNPGQRKTVAFALAELSVRFKPQIAVEQDKEAQSGGFEGYGT